MGELLGGGGGLRPDFGPVIVRHLLLNRFLRTRPARTLVVAPGGHGKSVIASQFAEAGEFDVILWVDMHGMPSGLDAMLQSIFRLLSSGHSRSAPVAVSEGTGLLLDVEGALSHFAGQQVCLVIDNISELADSSSSRVILDSLRRCTSGTSRLILAARSIDNVEPSGTDSWLLESQELLLDATEARELTKLLLGDDKVEVRADSLLRTSGGQVALFCVAARHLSLAGGDSDHSKGVPSDLASYLMHLAVSHLDAHERTLLVLAAMLQYGSSTDLLYLAGQEGEYASLDHIAECIPLLRLGQGATGRSFAVHEFAAEVYTHPDRMPVLQVDVDDLSQAVFDYIEANGNLERLFTLLLRMRLHDQIELRLERRGLALLDQGHSRLLISLFESISAARMVNRPMLLVVKAMTLRSMQQFDEALRLAEVARRASETTVGAESTAVQAALAMARVYVDTGRYAAVIECLQGVMGSPVLQDDPSLHCLALGFLATGYAYTGKIDVARAATSRAREAMLDPDVSIHARCMTAMCCAGILALVLGEFHSSGEMMAGVAADTSVPLSYATQARGNLAATLCETGQVKRALGIARHASEQCRSMGLTVLAETFMGTEATALAGLGEMNQAIAVMRKALDANIRTGDTYAAELERNYLAAMLRASGCHDESLAECERCCAFLATSSASDIDLGWAESELAASLLAVGDVRPAIEHAERSLTTMKRIGARHHALRCRLVLAEAARETGNYLLSSRLLSEDSEYLASGDGSWTIAMYIRAFPGLLGLVAAAVGVDRLPAHMLRMLMPEHARAALPLARDVLDEDAWRRLAVRMLGQEEAALMESSFVGEPLVHVRLFGGLEVTTPDGVVPDRAWRKRKARLVFMMLVVRQGRDVPRDVLLEHLWPDMDDERAKNNFYVIWSAMKRALLPGGRSAPCPYVEHVGGICRIVRPLVRSDLDEFDEALAALAEAESAGDLPRVLLAVQRIREAYRADLLPSEVYDDWFRQLRERCRVQYGDAMLRASRMCCDAGDPAQAVQLVRAGLEQDPWREDLYQVAMRCQIDTGQRSGAVDTFMACRSKLADDLGLDPSVETRRLYEEVLAMEEPPKD